LPRPARCLLPAVVVMLSGAPRAGGLPGGPVALRWRALYGLPAASTLTGWPGPGRRAVACRCRWRGRSDARYL